MFCVVCQDAIDQLVWFQNSKYESESLFCLLCGGNEKSFLKADVVVSATPSLAASPRRSVSPSSPPTPPPRQRYRPTKSLLQFTCHDLLLIPHQLLHALLLLLLLLFLTLLQTLVSSSCSSPIINAVEPPSFSTLSPQSISCGLDIKLGHWVPKFPFCSDTDIFQSC